jgi:high-affinity nickel-transport protein
MFAVLAAANGGAWALAFAAFHSRPALIATAFLAYTFGLRHAVDADHISAIDNVTRKLMQEEKRPIAVGFFFSLGHSTIVVALSLVIAVAATSVQRSVPTLQHVGGLIGTSVSALFLYAIAIVNLIVLVAVVRAFRALRQGQAYDRERIDEYLMQRGLIGRLCQPLIRLIDRSWQMYPLGVLFGLGFDTATEIGLLGIAAIEAGKGLPIFTILIFPLLFTVGMSLVDTTDGILALGAYGWAFVRPVRKLYYNMTITLISVLVAVLVGTIELLSVLVGQFDLAGPGWDAVRHLSDDFSLLGFAIVGIFLLSWGISALIYKARRYELLEPAERLPETPG